MNFYFTFGHGHIGFPGYVKITAPDVAKARETMVKHYGQQWCNQLDSLSKVDPMDRYLQDTLVWPE